MNSISSILSGNPQLFQSGQAVMQATGWWALRDPGAMPSGPDLSSSMAVHGRRGRRRQDATQIDLTDGAELEDVTVVEDGEEEASPKRPRRSPAQSKLAQSPKAKIPSSPTTKSGPASPIKSKSAIEPIKPEIIRPVVPSPIVKPAVPSFHAPVRVQTGVPSSLTPVPNPSSISRSLAAKPSDPSAQMDSSLQAPTQAQAPPTSAASLAAAEEIKRKLVERLLRVDSALLKQALSRDPTPTTNSTPNALKPSMAPAKKDSLGGKKKVKPAHYIRASPHENELAELTAGIAEPDEQCLRLRRKLAVRKVPSVPHLIILTAPSRQSG